MTTRPPLIITDPTSLTWVKATASGTNGECVEVAAAPAAVIAVRDSKDPHGPMLGFSSEAWGHFVSAVRQGEIAT